MNTPLHHAKILKQALRRFVLDAEGELAVVMERYIADHLLRSTKGHHQSSAQAEIILDRFLTAGQVSGQTPLDLWLEQMPHLSASDLSLLDHWRYSFTGLFVVEQVQPDSLQLMNWLTAKHYTVQLPGLESAGLLPRLKVGEMFVTRIAPTSEATWILFSEITLLGKLSTPKLAVAIGNFKQHYKEDLYGDAPDLLEAAWKSVEIYHQDFLDFFGTAEVTLSGYEANRKLQLLQEQVAQRYFSNSSLQNNKSLQQLADEAGVDQADLADMATDLGADAEIVEQMFAGKLQDIAKPSMATPQAQLPDHLKKAEQLTLLSHPLWGQMMIPTYDQFKQLLASVDPEKLPQLERLVHQYLEDPAINAYLWYRLAEHYPMQLEAALRKVLRKPDFAIATDLDALLEKNGKSLQPELPEIASVPLHLHTLFQSALQEVKKSKPKSGQKQKSVVGFKR